MWCLRVLAIERAIGNVDFSMRGLSQWRRYETFDLSDTDLKRPYTALASLINSSPDEIAIVTSATEAWQQVIYGLAWTWNPGDCLLTSATEYGSNYIAYLQLSKRTGIHIKIIPETDTGDIDLLWLDGVLKQKQQQQQPKNTGSGFGSIALVSINHVPTSSGRVYNVAGVGKLTKKYGVLFLLDACQSVGQLPVNVKEINCDFLTGTGRKYLRGPRG